MLDAPKQFIQTQPVASVDRGSEWIGGECDGFLSGAEGSSYIGVNEDGDDVFATTFWRSLWGICLQSSEVGRKDSVRFRQANRCW